MCKFCKIEDKKTIECNINRLKNLTPDRFERLKNMKKYLINVVEKLNEINKNIKEDENVYKILIKMSHKNKPEPLDICICCGEKAKLIEKKYCYDCNDRMINDIYLEFNDSTTDDEKCVGCGVNTMAEDEFYCSECLSLLG